MPARRKINSPITIITPPIPPITGQVRDGNENEDGDGERGGEADVTSGEFTAPVPGDEVVPVGDASFPPVTPDVGAGAIGAAVVGVGIGAEGGATGGGVVVEGGVAGGGGGGNICGAATVN